MNYYLIYDKACLPITNCDELNRFPYQHPIEDDLDRSNVSDIRLWRDLARGTAFVVYAKDPESAVALSEQYINSPGAVENIYCVKCDSHHQAISGNLVY